LRIKELRLCPANEVGRMLVGDLVLGLSPFEPLFLLASGPFPFWSLRGIEFGSVRFLSRITPSLL